MLGVELVVRLRKAGNDPHGDPLTDVDPPLSIPGCAVYPEYATEAEGRQSTTVVGFKVLAPNLDADILPGDDIMWRGGTFKVDGEVVPWRFMDGGSAALDFSMKRVKN